MNTHTYHIIYTDLVHLPETCRNSPLDTVVLYRRTEYSKAVQMSEPVVVILPISFLNGSVHNKSPKVMLPFNTHNMLI